MKKNMKFNILKWKKYYFLSYKLMGSKNRILQDIR